MNAKVYLVSQGEYSSYMIAAVFSDRSLAVAYCEMGGDSLDRIEEYDLDPGEDVLRERRVGWMVEMTWDGNVLKVHPYNPLLEEWSRWSPHNEEWQVCLWAVDESHAVKAANERRLIAVAGGVEREQHLAFRLDPRMREALLRVNPMAFEGRE